MTMKKAKSQKIAEDWVKEWIKMMKEISSPSPGPLSISLDEDYVRKIVREEANRILRGDKE